MKYLYSKIENLYNKMVSASGLALFRVFYGFVLLFEVMQLFYFRHLIFDKIPYFEPSEIDFTIPLVLRMSSKPTRMMKFILHTPYHTHLRICKRIWQN